MRLSVFLVWCISVLIVTLSVGNAVSAKLPVLTAKVMAFAGKPANSAFPLDEVAIVIPNELGQIAPIYVAKHEVTFGDWRACLDDGGCQHDPKRSIYTQDNHPVSGVSWHDAQQYIAWKSAKDGVQYRLPLESEWRALAVGVLDDTVEKLFDDPRLAWAADYANFSKRAERRTQPAGHFGTEDNGVADISGNVWEWTASCWRSPDASSQAETSENCGGVRVLAGVHMTYQSELIRVVPTGGCSIGFPPANIGFRLVRDIDQSTQSATRSIAKGPRLSG